MAQYRVNLVNVGSWSVEVEADSEEEAWDLAFEMAPTENIHTGFDMGEWTTYHDLFPDSTLAVPDIEALSD